MRWLLVLKTRTESSNEYCVCDTEASSTILILFDTYSTYFVSILELKSFENVCGSLIRKVLRGHVSTTLQGACIYRSSLLHNCPADDSFAYATLGLFNGHSYSVPPHRLLTLTLP